MTTADIVHLLQTRFGTQLQVERFKADFRARWTAPGESLQQLYQDIYRLVTLGYPSAEPLLISNEAFITALIDGRLQLEVMKCEPQNAETTLSYAIKVEAFEQLLASRGSLVDHDNGRAKRWPHTVCTVLDQSDASKTAVLHKRVDKLQEALEQATKGIAALATGP